VAQDNRLGPKVSTASLSNTCMS